MPIEDSGFLTGNPPWVSQIRTQHKPWFDLITMLNRLAMSVLLREAPKVPEELYVATLYARAVTMFQGAVLLAERGMAAESRTLVRGCAETAIALGCTRRDKTFPRQLDDDHDRHRVAMANDILNLPAEDPNVSAMQRDDLRRLIAEVSAQHAPSGPRKINWAVASSRAAMTDLYLTVYRQTSGDAAHVSLRSMDRHVVSDASGTITGFQFRPYPEEVADTLSSAIAALFHATEARLLGLGDTASDDALRGLALEWRTLVETSE
jgi:Family of unknown function (DUF5677)